MQAILPASVQASSARTARAYVHFDVGPLRVTGRQTPRRRIQLGALSLRVPRRGTAAVCIAYAAIGFAPISALALTIAGLWALPTGALILIIPAAVAAICLGIRSPREGRYAVEGLAAGLLAVLVYDLVRWTFVGFGWWGDFIPNIGGWLNGTGQADWLLGYGFRWLGDGGGMGIAFMVAARTLLPRPARGPAVALGIAYGLSIWLCLLVTLVVSPEGQSMLFPITAVTLLLSWIGHVVYGAVLGAMFGRTGTRAKRMPVQLAA
jgi:hypothetical protein